MTYGDLRKEIRKPGHVYVDVLINGDSVIRMQANKAELLFHLNGPSDVESHSEIFTDNEGYRTLGSANL